MDKHLFHSILWILNTNFQILLLNPCFVESIYLFQIPPAPNFQTINSFQVSEILLNYLIWTIFDILMTLEILSKLQWAALRACANFFWARAWAMIKVQGWSRVHPKSAVRELKYLVIFQKYISGWALSASAGSFSEHNKALAKLILNISHNRDVLSKNSHKFQIPLSSRNIECLPWNFS